jgi:hypothetical protein
MSGLELNDDEQTIFSSGSNHRTSNLHQVYVIIINMLEEFDDDNNPVINPQNLWQGANHMAEGESSPHSSRVGDNQTSCQSRCSYTAKLDKRSINGGTSTPYTSKRNACYRRKAKSEEGLNLSAQQARNCKMIAAMHHTPMEDGTTSLDLR